MFGVGAVELGVFLVLAVALVAVVAVKVTRSAVVAFGGGSTRSVTQEWQQVRGVRLLGVLAGVGAAFLVANLGSHGRGLMLAMAAFGLCVLVGTAVGETVVRPAPVPGPRSASLTPRRVRDYLPWTTPLVAFLVLATAAVLTLTTLVARDDGLGRARAVGCLAEDGSTLRTPFPGAWYSGPLALVLVVVLATAVVAARQVVVRPRGLARDDAGDDLLRRNSLDVVVAATGVAFGFPLAGVATYAGFGLDGVASAPMGCAPGWFAPAGWALLATGLVGLLATAHLLGRLLLRKAPGTP